MKNDCLMPDTEPNLSRVSSWAYEDLEGMDLEIEDGSVMNNRNQIKIIKSGRKRSKNW